MMMWTVKRNKYAGPFQKDTQVLRVQPKLFQMKLFSFPLWEDLHYGDVTAGIMKIHEDVCVTCTCHVHVPGETAGSSWICSLLVTHRLLKESFFPPFHIPILIGYSPAVTKRGGCKEGLRTHGCLGQAELWKGTETGHHQALTHLEKTHLVSCRINLFKRWLKQPARWVDDASVVNLGQAQITNILDWLERSVQIK